MRVTRIFVPQPLQSGSEAALPATGAHHVARVLRLRVDDALHVFDGRGGEYAATIVSIGGDRVRVRIGDFFAGSSESSLRIELIQGVSRGDRMDWALQKATELGVAGITPVLTARSVVKLDEKQAEKKREHWRNVVIGACEQSGRTVVPEIAEPVALKEFLSGRGKLSAGVVLSPTAQISLTEMNRPASQVGLLIGPEGGLEDDEIRAAQQAGFTPVRLGPRILRTETAAVTALTALQVLWGDLQ